MGIATGTSAIGTILHYRDALDVHQSIEFFNEVLHPNESLQIPFTAGKLIAHSVSPLKGFERGASPLRA